MKIFLFRHGEKQEVESADFGVKRGVTLSPLGIKQVERLAEELHSKFPGLHNLPCIYSSPFPRTIQSAEIVRSRLGIGEIKTVVALEEAYAYADYSKPKEYRKDLHRKMLIDPMFISPETHKSLKQILDEVLNFFDKLKKENPVNVLISTHGGVIRNLIYRIDENYRPSNDEIMDSTIAEGGYTILEYKEELKVLKFDVNDHLKGIASVQEE